MTRERASGFTLIEVAVAMVVIAVGLLAWVLFQESNIRGRSFSAKMTDAVELIQSRLDEGCIEVRDLDANGTTTQTETVTLNNLDYTVTRTLTGTDSLVPDGREMWRVHVRVDWDHVGSHSVELEKVTFGK